MDKDKVNPGDKVTKLADRAERPAQAVVGQADLGHTLNQTMATNAENPNHHIEQQRIDALIQRNSQLRHGQLRIDAMRVRKEAFEMARSIGRFTTVYELTQAATKIEKWLRDAMPLEEL